MPPYRSHIRFPPSSGKGSPLEDPAFVDRRRRAVEHCRDAAARRGPAYDFLRPPTDDDLRDVTTLAATLARGIDDLLILGAGAAGLCGRALSSACGDPNGRPRLHFIENIDPDSLGRTLQALDPDRTAFLAVSRSGETIETLALYDICLDWSRHRAGRVLCAEADGTLARKARSDGLKVHGFEGRLSGRFGIFSRVGLLPAALGGVDLPALIQGAAAVLAPLSETSGESLLDYPPLVGAALAVGLNQDHGVHVYGLMPYRDRLADFGRWIRQLWAESLGKDGKGMTPALLTGSVDHHSQLQLWLDGPRDRMMTLFFPPGDDGLLAEILRRQADFAAEALPAAGCVTRVIALENPLAGAVGALAAHFLVETWLAAVLLDVEPFGEPAVRRSKSDLVARFPALYEVE